MLTELTPLPWINALPVVALCVMRPLGVFLMLPMFQPSLLGGNMARNALALMIALPAVPFCMELHSLQNISDTFSFVLLIGQEIFIGLLIGFSVAIPFWAIDMAGYVIDTLRGSSMSSVLNPLLGDQSSTIGLLFGQVLAVLFLALGGFNLLLTAIYQSYILFVPGLPLDLSKNLPMFLSRQWHMMNVLCLTFSLPSMAVMLLVDIALGFINRSAQQLNVFFLSMPIKSILSLLLLIICLPFAFTNYLSHINSIGSILEQFK